MDEVEEFLAHFGVKGMKWGVRKKNVQAQRAKQYSAYADRLQGRIEKLDAKTPKTPLGRANQAKRREELVKQRDKAAKNAVRKAEGKLSSDDKKHIAQTAAFLGVMFLAFAPVLNTGKMSSSNMTVRRGKETALDILKRTKGEQLSSLQRTFREGHMDKAQYENFSRVLRNRYARQIAEAAKAAGGG